ncbi:uncharacterized protein LOC134722286 [Mytilus trossulus]|uniref:uncharacterized protein LOC134722286 n=1 Tax=Mytilus trossulus TaxID=6551 RepID=UPI00300641FC
MEYKCDEHHLYRREFYVLWCAGINEEPPVEDVMVCSTTVDEGSTTIIRIFHSLQGDALRADEKFLEWITNDPYVSESSTLELEIIANESPPFSFSNAFCDLIASFKEAEKTVEVQLKIVRLKNIEEWEEEYEDNRDGLRYLHSTGIMLSPVSGKDWGYLRQILRENKGNLYQENNYLKVRKRLSKIIKNPKDVSTASDVKSTTETETSTVHSETIDAETMTDMRGGETIFGTPGSAFFGIGKLGLPCLKIGNSG